MKPRIAIFLHTLAMGGIGLTMSRMSRIIIKRGINVEFVIARSADDQRQCALPEGATRVDLNCSRMMSCLLPLARYLRRQRPDAMLAAPTHANVLAVLAKSLARVHTRVVLNEATPLMNESQHLNASLANRLMYRLVPLTYARADAVVAVSRGVADQLSEGFGIPASHIDIIPNPVVTPTLLTDAQEPVDHSWFVQSPGKLLIAVGRLSPEKGYDILLSALAMARCRRTDLHLIIVGDGPQRPQLESQIESLGLTQVVSLVGFQDNAVAWIAKSDLLVQPSRYEGFGNTLVEALACGTPVVSTTCPCGPQEILDEGRYGALAPPEDAASLAEAILSTLATPADASLLRERAAHFIAEPIVDRYLKLLLGSAYPKHTMLTPLGSTIG